MTTQARVQPPIRPTVSGLARALWCISLLSATGLGAAACGGGGGGHKQTDPCGGHCLTELGEVCDADTGTCYFPQNDAGPDGGDATPDTPGDLPLDQADGDGGGCTTDDQCAPAQYCGTDGTCRTGCRAGDADNCDDCSLFPATCQNGLACHPIDHECVGGCVADDGCDANRFCDLTNGLCERGCRTAPDNCAGITGGNDFVCDEGTHACVDGPCDGDSACPDGAYCDVDACVWGCRTDPDSCGSGQQCDPTTRSCGSRPCNCAASDSDETCDALCDTSDGGPSGYYCDRVDQTCRFGCRIRDDGTDTCRPGTVCDEGTRTCLPGCRIDETCPYLTYCDNGTCAAGCKTGECDPPEFCDLDARSCTSQACTADATCPDATYCSTDDFCLEGCRIDNPATSGVDEDNCAGDLICDATSRHCVLPSCDADSDCPLGEYCSVQSQCTPGCAGMDERCPAGEPCSDLNGFCGCTRDADCSPETHCTVPVCEVDCTPEDFSTPAREDSCPAPEECDPSSGRCVGDCLDSLETSTRNDTPDTATCLMFLASDQADANQVRLCKAGETHLPPSSYCDGQEGSYCADATACTGGDFDWYTMYLYSGDTISFYAHYAQPSTTTFVLELVSADNPAKRLRGAAPNETGVGTANFHITQTGQYLLRAFAVSDTPVPYQLEVRVDRTFTCFDDIYEPNGNPDGNAPEIENSEVEQTFPGTICQGDRDFFAIDLFAGNQFTGILDPDQADAALQLNLGTPNDAGTDLDPTTGGGNVNIAAGPYTDPSDPSDPNDVIIDHAAIPQTDRYYVRVRAPDPSTETFYELSATTDRGSATCPNTAYEPNDTANPSGFPSSAEYRVRDLGVPSQKDFANARVCPADSGPADVDYYMVTVDADDADGFLTAALAEHSDENRLALAVFHWNGAGIDPVATLGDPTQQVTTSASLAAGTYFVLVAANASGPELTWMGASYDLSLRYESAQCIDDGLEPNPDPGSAVLLHSTFLLGTGTECGGIAFSPACSPDTVGSPPLCLCLQNAGLVMCPGDEDWYLVRLLVGDSLSVRITPTGGASSGDLTAILWPPQCATPGDLDACGETVTLFSNTGTALQVVGKSVAPPAPGVILAPYYIQVMNNTGDAVQYQILSEVLGEDSRNCPADPWDASYQTYPNANETSCVSGSCTLTAGDINNSFRHGQICFWDQQDWFKFSLGSPTDLDVRVEYFPDQGRIDGTLWHDNGGTLEKVRDLDDRTAAHGLPEGIEWVFGDLAAGTYQIELGMPGRDVGVLGSSPNDYTVHINSTVCGDGLWSMGEACDETSPISDATMCGSGHTCTSCTCN